MNLILFVTFLNTIGSSLSAISVNRVNVRTPRVGDIGLIFDINLINTANEEKELLEYRIRPGKECCLNITEHSMTTNGGKIVGGSFGQIEPGALQTISVIWPTTAIFNRVGHCEIIISSTNIKDQEKEFTQQLRFDTRFSTIDAAATTFRRRKKYMECPSWDMDFLNACTPVDCEEKYLGKRSFYNKTTRLCEPVPKCSGKDEIYDIYANECTDVSSLMSAEIIDDMKKGKYENNSLDLKTDKVLMGKSKSCKEEPVAKLSRRAEESSVRSQLLSGVLIVLATICTYISMCFLIFLLVNWLSKMSARPGSPAMIRRPM